ncbi:MAG TPA: phosphate ABC transporter permease PstA [Firmicutes bacterium]|nr:phosphate ABC transporter permease PstA [Bacillota bacterium]
MKQALMATRRRTQKVAFSLSWGATALTLAFFFIIVAFIARNGLPVMSIQFLTDMPRMGMTEGGIFPAILGTFYLMLGSIIFALPIGVLGAIYLTEYAKQGMLMRMIRIGVNSLSGVPSIVFGLFGLSVFVKFMGFGVSILSGSLTLGILILPTIIRASEEALMAVPHSFREASLALGATRWQTVRKVVLPAAIPGILTGCILGVGRAAGETAPILFTAATFYTMRLPGSIFDEVLALPYHIYALMTEGTMIDKQMPIAYGSALVLLFLVLSFNLAAIIIRMNYARKKQW